MNTCVIFISYLHDIQILIDDVMKVNLLGRLMFQCYRKPQRSRRPINKKNIVAYPFIDFYLHYELCNSKPDLVVLM